MKKIIFDTETTGLNSCENQIAQLSYTVVDEEFNIINAKNFYFTVDFVEEDASRVNGLDIEILQKLSNDKRFRDFAEEIYNDFLNADVWVAHNLNFDLGFLMKEFQRLGFDKSKLRENKEYFCTMKYYTEVIGIEHYYYGYKYPKLEEVMYYLDIENEDIEEKTKEIFKCDAAYYHDSRLDVIATLEAYKRVAVVEKMKCCQYIVHSFSSLKECLEDVEHKYISKVNLDDSYFKNIEDACNILLGDDKKSLKRSFQRIVKKINYIIDVIEEDERTGLEK